MPDATLNPLPPGVLPAGVTVATGAVNIVGLNPILMAFLVRLGLIHLHLWDTIAVITSAKDGKHTHGSKHDRGDAVDLRTKDKSTVEQETLLEIVLALERRYPIAVFDERNMQGNPHIHVEVAG
jgi:hypothetical protein